MSSNYESPYHVSDPSKTPLGVFLDWYLLLSPDHQTVLKHVALDHRPQLMAAFTTMLDQFIEEHIHEESNN